MDENQNEERTYYNIPDICDSCGSDEGFIVFFLNHCNQMRVGCKTCGHTWALKKYDDAPKRDGNTQNRWANRVKERDHYVCQICGSTANVEAHHLISVQICQQTANRMPENRFLLNNEHNGITLCKKCHNLVHGKILKF